MISVLVIMDNPKHDRYLAIGAVVDKSITSGQTKFSDVPDESFVDVRFRDGEQFSIQKKDLISVD